MPQEPPPLPEASRKRILPAFVLCFVLCAHRIYAGRYISGIIQIAVIAGGFYWLKIEYKGLLDIVQNSPLNMDTVERINDWEQTHGLPIYPVLVQIIPLVWVAADAGRLLARKFTDGEGRKITRWV